MKNLIKKMISAVTALGMVLPGIILPAYAQGYDPGAASWKFDFGPLDQVAEGYIGVSADTNYTDSLEYGFIGTSEKDYKLSAGGLMDSFTTLQGQKIVLANGSQPGGAGEGGPNGDFVAVTPGNGVAEPQNYYDYTTDNPIRFSMAVQNGGYYHVKVVLANASSSEDAKVSLYTERRHQLLTDRIISPGETVTHEFNVDVATVFYKSISGDYKDDTISVEVTGQNAAIASMEVTNLTDNPGTTLWVMGDSTGCDQGSVFPYFPLQNYAGTGQWLAKYLPADVALSNQGDGGINSGDTSHYKNVKLKSGDYLYAEWGHNEKSTEDYVKNMEKYYRDCVKAGANLLIVGPIDRCQSGQFNSQTGTWKPMLDGYSAAGKAFVERVLTDTEYVKGILGADYGSYTADELDHIAFVDINAGWISFMNEIAQEVSGIRGNGKYEDNSAHYYFKTDRKGNIDHAHENDAGADNAAHIFFTGAMKQVAAGDANKFTVTSDKDQTVKLFSVDSAQSETYVKDIPVVAGENLIDVTGLAGDGFKVTGQDGEVLTQQVYKPSEQIISAADAAQSKVLAGIVDTMRKHTPYHVPEEIIAAGPAANQYYPVPAVEEYSGYEALIKKPEFNGEGLLESVTIKMEHYTGLSAKGITYALAGVEIYNEDGSLQGTYYSHVDTKYDVTNGNGKFSLVFQDPAAVLPQGGTYKIWLQGIDEEGNVQQGTEYRFSEYFTQADISPVDEYVIGDYDDIEIPDTFSYFGVKNGSSLNGNNGWKTYGSASYQVTLEDDGQHTYADIKRNGTSGTFYLYRPFNTDNGISGSKIVFDADISYKAGTMTLYLSKSSYSLTDKTAYMNCFTIKDGALYDRNNNKLQEITADTWTHIQYELDYDYGTEKITVGDKEYTGTVDSLQALLPDQLVPSSMKQMNFTGSGLLEAKMTNVSVKKMVQQPLPQKQLSLSTSGDEKGTVSIQGQAETTAAVPMNTEMTITAAAKKGYAFKQWQDEQGQAVSSEAQVKIRVHKDLKLTAVFEEVVTTPEPELPPGTLAEDFEGDVHSFTATSNAFWEPDAAALNQNTSGKIYGVQKGAGAYWTFDQKDKATKVSLEFRMDGCGSKKSSDVALLGAHNEGSSLSSTSRILQIHATSPASYGNGYWESITLNGTDITALAKSSQKDEGTDLKRDTTGWLKLEAALHFDSQTADINLVRISDGTTVYSGTLPFADQVSSLTEIFIGAGSGYGGVYLDNIMIQDDVPEPTINPTTPPTEKPTIPPTQIPTQSPTTTPTQAPDGVLYQWDFATDQTVQSGFNVPVISGAAAYDAVNQNIKFDANTTKASQLTVSFREPLKKKTVIEFDMNIARLGSQVFSYKIADSEGFELIDCKFNPYDKNAAGLAVGGVVVAADSEITSRMNTVTDDGMKGPATHFKNEIDFATGEVVVTIKGQGEGVYKGTLQKGVTGDAALFEMASARSKAAGRSGYVDNITISQFKSTAPTPAPTERPRTNELNIVGTYDDGNEVGVTVAGGFTGTALAGLYQKDGRLLQVKMQQAVQTAHTFKFTKPENTEGAVICLYNWDMAEMTPKDQKQQVELKDIAPPASASIDNFLYDSLTATVSSDGEMQYGHEMPYRYYLPANYDSSKQYPVVMYLHGEARTGSDNTAQLYNAQYMFEALLSEENITKYPCILVAPQCPEGEKWVDTDLYSGSYDINNVPVSDEICMARDVVLKLEQEFSVDREKVYVAGQSMGGYGVWDIIMRNPEMFAAALPMGGAGSPADEGVKGLAANNTAVWAFCGKEDTTVPTQGSKDMVSKMVSSGCSNVLFTEYPNLSSKIHPEVAEEEGLYEWLFSKSLTDNKKAEKETVDLTIFMGQSNMAGRGEAADATKCIGGHGYEFRSVTDTNLLYNITEPFGKDEDNQVINDYGSDGKGRRSGDMVSSLMEAYYNETKVPMVGVSCTRGGTSTSYWVGSSVLQECVLRLNTAKKYLQDNGYNIRHTFMVWCQGEGDGDDLYSGKISTDTYKQRTMAVFNHMMNAGVEQCFIVQTGAYNSAYSPSSVEGEDEKHENAYQAIAAAQQELEAEINNVKVVASFNGYLAQMKDKFHYHQPAYNEVGTLAGKNIAEFIQR